MTENDLDGRDRDDPEPKEDPNANWVPPGSDAPFLIGLCILGGFYLLLIVAMLAADIYFAAGDPGAVFGVLATEEIRYATWLSLMSCCVTTILALWVAIPIGYLMSRFEFRGKAVVDAMLDIPIFLPPLVVGLSLLILFRQTPLVWLDDRIGIALAIPAVILAQFAVASAFAVRTLRATFDEISPRQEQVALTLGCSSKQAFWLVVIPQAWRGILTAATLAWARSLGEFGPLMIFAGSTRMKTEVLPISVYLEFSIGNIEGAVGISLLMVVVALAVLIFVRVVTGEKMRV
jgi:molybdate transport system permease protein